MTVVIQILQAIALMLGLFTGMTGVGAFVVGLLWGKSARVQKQYRYAAVYLAASYYLMTFAITGGAP